MATTIKVAVYTNSDDAFVAWAPSEFVPTCRGFMLERGHNTAEGEVVETVQNRLGFKKDKPKSGDHRPADEWPFQRFNWTDMLDTVGGRPYKKGVASDWTPWVTMSADAGGGFSCFFNRGLVLSQFVARYLKVKNVACEVQGAAKEKRRSRIPCFPRGRLGQ